MLHGGVGDALELLEEGDPVLLQGVGAVADEQPARGGLAELLPQNWTMTAVDTRAAA